MKSFRSIRRHVCKIPGAIFLLPCLLAGQIPVLGQAAGGFQEPVLASLAKDLDLYRSERLQEKVYVHTDKEFYLAGEICWFKLYDVDATMHRPLDLSKVAYLEWLDKNNKPVLQAKIGLQQGHGEGSVYLPLTLLSGNYKLRAYTSWMKNYEADWFFEKPITIINARKTAGMPAAEPPPEYHIAFFPEGGNLVENIPGKLAFRATDQYGRGIECTGVITEDDADTVARFRPLRFGMGHFLLTPRRGHRYRSTIRLKDGTAISHLLPSALTEGMVMHVWNEDSVHIRVEVESTLPSGRVYLFAHTRQSVKWGEAASLRQGKCSFLLEKGRLGDGISHLTLFNAARQPICERLYFKMPSHRLKIDLHTDQVSYAKRSKIQVRLGFSGMANTFSGADCSLSVYRLDSLQGIPAGQIESYFWLSSDLQGRVESPEYYFDHPEDVESVDNLMMTHGWRRFRWGDVLQQASPVFAYAPEYKGSIITGKIVHNRTGLPPSQEMQGYLSVPGTRTQFAAAYCDEQGRVKFEMSDFYGSQEIVVQTNPTSLDSLYRIDIANPFSESYTNTALTPFAPPLPFQQLLRDKSLAVKVLNRYAGEKLKQFSFPAADTTPFYYKPDFRYLLDDYTRFTTMEEVMREYVRLMLVQRKEGHFHLPLYDLPNNAFFELDPLILLDGVPIFNNDELMALDPLKIRKLDVLTRKYFMGASYFDGIMNWITYKGDLGGYILDPHATVLDYEGLQLKREFYAPAYETEQQAATHLPDFRNVLYWLPVVPLNAQGAGTLSFYSSDLPGQYIVLAEGLGAEGTAGSGIVRFEVK